MFPDDETRLRHIWDAGQQIVAFTEGRSRADLDSDALFAHAVTNLLIVIGEAASKISEARRAELAQVPWREIIATRNRLIHAYHDISLDVIWDSATRNVPELLQELPTPEEENTD
jgi:uncharacterized protein with HEPN domain